MPIDCSAEVRVLEQEQFHAIDRRVMGHAFEIHNALGRFLDEPLYQEALARKCILAGLGTRREVHLRVSHEGFVKPYYLDLLIEHGAVYELKAVEALTGNHEKQLISYLLLAGLKHGKLINFRPGSVEARYVSTSLTWEDRTAFELVDEGWDGDDPASWEFRERLQALLSDWGAFLEIRLYREALLHLIPSARVTPVQIAADGHALGAQNMCLLTPDTAWHISAIRRHLKTYHKHIQRLLTHTPLKRIHWVNLDHKTITLKTLSKK